jgi:hypothetical protein
LALSPKFHIGPDYNLFGFLKIDLGLYAEVDTNERTDATYDAAFSSAGTTDRIRSSKYGTVLGLGFKIAEDIKLDTSYVQKLGGYDAPATQAYNFLLSYNF